MVFTVDARPLPPSDAWGCGRVPFSPLYLVSLSFALLHPGVARSSVKPPVQHIGVEHWTPANISTSANVSKHAKAFLEQEKVAEENEDFPEDLLFVGVISSPSYAAQRDYIRHGWMQSPLIGIGRPVDVRFFIGIPKSAEAQILAREQRDHQDIIQLNAPEGYGNLTAKTLGMLRWVTTYKKVKYVMKVDDDTYPNFNGLLPMLMQSTDKYSLHGHIFPCAPVLNFTKWAESPRIFNQAFYPTYAQGSAYIVSWDLAVDLGRTYYADHKRNMLHNEDASVGLWIRRDRILDPELMGVKFVDIQRTTLYGCSAGDMISMNIQSHLMPCMYEKQKRGEESFCCPEMYKRGKLDYKTQDTLLQRRQSKAPVVQLLGIGSSLRMDHVDRNLAVLNREKFRCRT